MNHYFLSFESEKDCPANSSDSEDVVSDRNGKVMQAEGNTYSPTFKFENGKNITFTLLVKSERGDKRPAGHSTHITIYAVENLTVPEVPIMCFCNCPGAYGLSSPNEYSCFRAAVKEESNKSQDNNKIDIYSWKLLADGKKFDLSSVKIMSSRKNDLIINTEALVTATASSEFEIIAEEIFFFYCNWPRIFNIIPITRVIKVRYCNMRGGCGMKISSPFNIDVLTPVHLRELLKRTHYFMNKACLGYLSDAFIHIIVMCENILDVEKNLVQEIDKMLAFIVELGGKGTAVHIQKKLNSLLVRKTEVLNTVVQMMKVSKQTAQKFTAEGKSSQTEKPCILVSSSKCVNCPSMVQLRLV
ncbi:uncharacterized protein LOC142328042 [Lycorma delicatula]|uniref:uncharacterized protein LOC142328042 n=1 Tax=Lycorma delicatula TaxID=130591 RepID=UPI003F51558C